MPEGTGGAVTVGAAQDAACVDVVTFGELCIAFDERVLRPRQWTSAQSDWATQLSSDVPHGAVLELCAGAGSIGLLAAARTGRPLVAVDADPVAAAYAVRNARRAGLADRVEVRTGRFEDVIGCGERYPLVLADPPWVPRQQTDRYPEDPLSAIDGGHDGLDVARGCLATIGAHLGPGGAAVIQVGSAAQADALADGAARHGLRVVQVRHFPRGALMRLDHLDTRNR